MWQNTFPEKRGWWNFVRLGSMVGHVNSPLRKECSKSRLEEYAKENNLAGLGYRVK